MGCLSWRVNPAGNVSGQQAEEGIGGNDDEGLSDRGGSEVLRRCHSGKP